LIGGCVSSARYCSRRSWFILSGLGLGSTDQI